MIMARTHRLEQIVQPARALDSTYGREACITLIILLQKCSAKRLLLKPANQQKTVPDKVLFVPKSVPLS